MPPGLAHAVTRASETPFSWDPRWGPPVDGMGLRDGMLGDVNRSPGRNDFKQARRWATMQTFVRGVMQLRQTFYNYGLLGKRLTPGEVEYHPGIQAVRKADRKAVAAWKAKERWRIVQLVTAIWREWLTLDNVIVLWRRAGAPVIFAPEDILAYTDTFGIELLTLALHLSETDLKRMALTPAEVTALKSGKLELTHEHPLFDFTVLKRERVGYGLAWPGLTTIFHACATGESLEVSDRALADSCRNVYEQHRLGHEIKSGPHAGSAVHFIKKPRAEAVLADVKGKKGGRQLVTNFDHEILLGAGLPDPKRFEASRYQGVTDRLAMWSMPVGQMLLGKQVNPFLMTLLRVQAEAERELMEPLLHAVLETQLRAPAPLTFQWDSSIFWDSRLMLDLLKNGLNAGPLSQTTFTERAGFNRAAELERKEAEARLPMDLKGPAWDPNHGTSAVDGGGRPPGTMDPPP